jgi:hypothetical protein
MLRVIGVDIGIRNLSLCLFEAQREGGATAAVCLLERGRAAVTSARSIEFITTDISQGAKNANRCAHSAMLDGLVDFFTKNRSIFQWATDVVIESQPAARMKMISAAFYVLSRAFENLRVSFQSAQKKLAWGPKLASYVPGIKTKTYSDRKKAAVTLMTQLLTDSEKHENILVKLGSMKKKDDAADSFLHALCYFVHAPVSSSSSRACVSESRSSLWCQDKADVVVSATSHGEVEQEGLVLSQPECDDMPLHAPDKEEEMFHTESIIEDNIEIL